MNVTLSCPARMGSVLNRRTDPGGRGARLDTGHAPSGAMNVLVLVVRMLTAGAFYAQGGKANMLSCNRKPALRRDLLASNAEVFIEDYQEPSRAGGLVPPFSMRRNNVSSHRSAAISLRKM